MSGPTTKAEPCARCGHSDAKVVRMLPSEVWERMSTDPVLYARMHKAADRAIEREIRRLNRKDKEA